MRQECSPDLALFSRADYNRFIGITHLDPILLLVSKTCAKPLCILHRSPTFPSGSLFGLPPSLNSRRLAHSVHPPYLRFLSMLPHSIAPFRNPHGFISYSQRTCSRLFFLEHKNLTFLKDKFV